MADFPYTNAHGKLNAFLQKTRDAEVPDKATAKWLKSVGFKGNYDYTLLRVLKALGFADKSGSPAQVWKDYRGTKPKQVLAKCIRTAYSPLYDTYANAHDRSDEEIADAIRAKSDADEPTRGLIVNTFRALCALADYEEEESSQGGTAGDGSLRGTVGRLGAAVTVNINVQVTLPETTDETVYDKVFAAMKKHLFGGQASDD